MVPDFVRPNPVECGKLAADKQVIDRGRNVPWTAVAFDIHLCVGPVRLPEIAALGVLLKLQLSDQSRGLPVQRLELIRLTNNL